MDKYSGPLFNAAYRITRGREDAGDATQAAFVKAYEKLPSFDFDHRFFSWIYRIALNEALDIAARRRRETHIDGGLSRPGAISRANTPRPSAAVWCRTRSASWRRTRAR